MNPILSTVEQASLREKPLGEFQIGDTVNVHTRIREGDKERTQVFTGTVIARKRGHGAINECFTVRRIVDGVGVERVFPVHSPKVQKVEVARRGRVRRAKLYYLRERVGKRTKVKEKLAGRVEGASGPAGDEPAAGSKEQAQA